MERGLEEARRHRRVGDAEFLRIVQQAVPGLGFNDGETLGLDHADFKGADALIGGGAEDAREGVVRAIGQHFIGDGGQNH
ncbi:hypothetical protein [Devosia sp.]|uniref:hypothetical protein n=1 Tax=Devosia sp. TaxID=1871048 RepID=UPI0025FB715A|nr:hypothetical protein [Devosia sp.]MCR6634183.1 hypothetical protein [Devosia sp.]